MAENLRKYFLYFLSYSVIGWLYEVFLEVVVYKWGFTNRGVLLGPYCPVYGVGTVIFILTVYRLIRYKSSKERLKYIPLVFVLTMVVATAVELATAYCLDIFNIKAWDYSNYAFNFKGKIALNPSVRFGIGGTFFLYVLQPLFEKIYQHKKINIIALPLAIIFILDIVFSFLISYNH